MRGKEIAADTEKDLVFLVDRDNHQEFGTGKKKTKKKEQTENACREERMGPKRTHAHKRNARPAEMQAEEIWHQGGCHCGAVRWEVQGPAVLHVLDCNCSICMHPFNSQIFARLNIAGTKKGILHYIVPKSKFKLLKGEDSLSCYTFNTGTTEE